ncbi:hypothetical protein VTH06DRAFT_5132 [Thermothelomyces fergusii]
MVPLPPSFCFSVSLSLFALLCDHHNTHFTRRHHDYGSPGDGKVRPSWRRDGEGYLKQVCIQVSLIGWRSAAFASLQRLAFWEISCHGLTTRSWDWNGGCISRDPRVLTMVWDHRREP